VLNYNAQDAEQPDNGIIAYEFHLTGRMSPFQNVMYKNVLERVNDPGLLAAVIKHHSLAKIPAIIWMIESEKLEMTQDIFSQIGFNTSVGITPDILDVFGIDTKKLQKDAKGRYNINLVRYLVERHLYKPKPEDMMTNDRCKYNFLLNNGIKPDHGVLCFKITHGYLDDAMDLMERGVEPDESCLEKMLVATQRIYDAQGNTVCNGAPKIIFNMYTEILDQKVLPTLKAVKTLLNINKENRFSISTINVLKLFKEAGLVLTGEDVKSIHDDGINITDLFTIENLNLLFCNLPHLFSQR